MVTGRRKLALLFFSSVLCIFSIQMMTETNGLSRTLSLSESYTGTFSLQHTSKDDEPIRRWGCHRTETPFIFVHIAKAGGGTNRRRFAAAAQGYDRGDKWWQGHLDEHHYPVRDDSNGGVRHAKFCNSENPRFHIPYHGNIVGKTFEGTKPCNATTPIGHAIGCPSVQKCLGCRDANSRTCDTVYVGHNMLGSEMHWLPPKYLQKWWQTNWATKSSVAFERISSGFQSIVPGESVPQWCPKHNMSRPQEDVFSRDNIQTATVMECSNLVSQRADADLKQFWSSIMAKPNNYSPLYASLPLHRVVMLREPFSWIKSKFYWERINKQFACDDIQGVRHWAHGAIKNFTLELCGEDCRSRVDTNAMTLEEVIDQAESNLRQSFSVVGLLNETESFYNMVETRLSYMNMSIEVHPGLIEDGRHSSQRAEKNKTEYERCSNAFVDDIFQQRFREEIPIMTSLEYLYHVGVKVNRFQKDELNQCRGQTGMEDG